MTDSNGMLKSDNSAHMDDDPLAELARIVSGDTPKEAVATPPSTPANQSATSSTSTLDLEAELLGELDDAFGEPASAPIAAQAEPSAASLEATLEQELLKELVGDTHPSAAAEPVQEKPKTPFGITSIVEDDTPAQTEPVQAEPVQEVIEQAEITQVEQISAQIAAQPVITETLTQEAPQPYQGDTATLEDMFEQSFGEELQAQAPAPAEPTLDPMSQDLGDAFNQSVEQMSQDQNAALGSQEPSFEPQVANPAPYGAPQYVAPQNVAEDRYSDPAADVAQSGLYAEPAAANTIYSDPALDAAFDDPGSLAGEEIDGPHFEENEPTNKGKGMKLAIGALALSLIAGIAVASWGVFGGEEQVAENIPVVPADSTPVKVKPVDPGGKQIDNTQNEVYENVNVDNKITTDQETLISERQEPIDVEPKSAARLSPDSIDEASNNLGGVSPKRVKTLTIKPDGSIVRASEPEKVIASTKPEPVKPVAVKTVPAPAKPAAPATTTAQNTPTPIAAAPASAPVSPAPVAQSTRPATSVAAPTQIAALPASNTPATVAPVANSPYYVQVSSQRSAAAAQASFDNIKKRFSSILAGKQASIQSGVVANKGTFYRAKVPAASRQEANNLCASLKRAGGSCFVTR